MNKRTETHSIASAKILDGLSNKQKTGLERFSSAFQVRSGTALTTEGTVGREFGVLISGTATVTVGETVVATLASGDHYGEVALLAGVGTDTTHRTATVTADDDIWVSVMTTQEFDSLTTSFPDVVDAIRQGAADRVRANNVLV